MADVSIYYFVTSVGLFLYNFVAADLAKESSDSWIKGTLGGLPTEIAGSIVDRNYELVKSKLRDRFPRLIRDNQQTLYKSVRHSQLEAIRDACNAFRDEIKNAKSEKYDLEYIEQIENYLRTEESKLTRGDFIDIKLNEDVIRQIILNNKIPQNIQTDSSQALKKELPKYGSQPARFIEMLEKGWQKNKVDHSLFERFEFHFNVELAKPGVANVLFKNALSGIQFTLEEILAGQSAQEEKFDHLGKLIEKNAAELKTLGYQILYKESGEVKGFEFIEEKLDRIESKITDGFISIQDTFDNFARDFSKNSLHNNNSDRETLLAISYLQMTYITESKKEKLDYTKKAINLLEGMKNDK